MNQQNYNWDRPKQDKLKDWSKSSMESHGNCWQHAIAAVLQVPAAEVPDFLGQAIEQESNVDAITQEWLNERGFLMVYTRGENLSFPRFRGNRFPTVPWLACGPTPRSQGMGNNHVVVMVGREMVYDPHPDSTGLTAVTDCYLVLPLPKL